MCVASTHSSERLHITTIKISLKSWASFVAQLVKYLPAVQETQALSLGWEDPLEKKMVTHSSILAWRKKKNLKKFICALYVKLASWQTVQNIVRLAEDNNK